MVEGNVEDVLLVTYLKMLLAMDLRLPGQMMLKSVEIFYYCVLQSEIYKDFNIIITHYIFKPSSFFFSFLICHTYSLILRIVILYNRFDCISEKSSSISSSSNSSNGAILDAGS